MTDDITHTSAADLAIDEAADPVDEPELLHELDPEAHTDDDEADFVPLIAESIETEREHGEFTLHPTVQERNLRLDKFIAGNLSTLSRSYIQQLIAEEHVSVDGRIRAQTFKVTPGQTIRLLVPPPVADVLQPEDIPLDIIYEDADLLVLNKRPGMVVHPAPGHATGTLANAILHHVPEVVMAGSHRPGIVHRLDKDTSGLIVVAKTERGRLSLLSQWAERSVEKRYLALAYGVMNDDEAGIDLPIGRDPAQRNRMAVHEHGREARSHVTVLERFADASYLKVAIETGRTHQIRVHLAYIGHPIVGDTVYNRFKGRAGGVRSIAARQMLHAAALTFDTPDGERLALTAPLPSDMAQALGNFRGLD